MTSETSMGIICIPRGLESIGWRWCVFGELPQYPCRDMETENLFAHIVLFFKPNLIPRPANALMVPLFSLTPRVFFSSLEVPSVNIAVRFSPRKPAVAANSAPLIYRPTFDLNLPL